MNMAFRNVKDLLMSPNNNDLCNTPMFLGNNGHTGPYPMPGRRRFRTRPIMGLLEMR